MTTCTTHHACDCIMERIERIEAVYQKYKHLSHLLNDEKLMLMPDEDGNQDLMGHIFYDLWQAVRREE